MINKILCYIGWREYIIEHNNSKYINGFYSCSEIEKCKYCNKIKRVEELY